MAELSTAARSGDYKSTFSAKRTHLQACSPVSFWRRSESRTKVGRHPCAEGPPQEGCRQFGRITVRHGRLPYKTERDLGDRGREIELEVGFPSRVAAGLVSAETVGRRKAAPYVGLDDANTPGRQDSSSASRLAASITF